MDSEQRWDNDNTSLTWQFYNTSKNSKTMLKLSTEDESLDDSDMLLFPNRVSSKELVQQLRKHYR